jgi:hypothetical protein
VIRCTSNFPLDPLQISRNRRGKTSASFSTLNRFALPTCRAGDNRRNIIFFGTAAAVPSG